MNKLVAEVRISEKAQVSPKSDSEVDFSNPVKYTLTAEDGTTKTYTVRVSYQKSSEKKILKFGFEGFNEDAVIDETKKEIRANGPWTGNLSSLKPYIQISAFANVSPDPALHQDFSKDVIYTVTAEDGSTQAYKVITASQPKAALITPLSKTTYMQGDAVQIEGNYFSDASVKIRNTNTADTYNYTPSVNQFMISFSLSGTIVYGTYDILLTIRGTEYSGGRITINPYVSPLSIGGYGSVNSAGGIILQVQGSGFAAQGNKVYLVKNGVETQLPISNETSTRITAWVDAQIPAGKYFIKVTHADGRTVTSSFTFDF